MKLSKIAVLLILGIVLAQGSLFATIYCRIEGYVKDKDTGLAIPNVNVSLEIVFDEFPVEVVRTDKKGYFAFNKVKARWNYYVVCEKDNYISNVPPYIRDALRGLLDNPYWLKLFRVFDLKEGDIKRLYITLERGGGIKGKLLLKDSNGITPVKNMLIELEKEHEETDIIPASFYSTAFQIDHIRSSETGEFSFMGLKPGNKYSIILDPHENFADQIIEPIEVKVNETCQIEFTFDLESKTGIKGTVTKNGSPLDDMYIIVVELPDRIPYGDCSTDKLGQYSFLMLPPGYYEVRCSYYAPDGEKFRKKENVKIEENQVVIVNFDF